MIAVACLNNSTEKINMRRRSVLNKNSIWLTECIGHHIRDHSIRPSNSRTSLCDTSLRKVDPSDRELTYIYRYGTYWHRWNDHITSNQVLAIGDGKSIFNLSENEDRDACAGANVDSYSISWIGIYQMGTAAQKKQTGEARKRQRNHLFFEDRSNLTRYEPICVLIENYITQMSGVRS